MRYPFILGFVLLAACSSGDDDLRSVQPVEPVGERGVPMSFNAVAEPAATRAALEETCTHFGVWATKLMPNGTEQTVMDGYEVEYLTTRPSSGGATWGTDEGQSYWSYDHINGQVLRYWDPSADEYHFHAVAPYTSPTRSLSVDVEGDYVLGVAPDNTFGTGSATQALGSTVVATEPMGKLTAYTRRLMAGYVYDYDMIASYNGELIQDNDPTNDPSTNDPTNNNPPPTGTRAADELPEVPLQFHPLYSKIEFRLYCDPEALQAVSFSEVTIETKSPIITAGDYTPGPSYTNTTTNTVGFKITDLSLSPSAKEDAKSTGTLYELPQSDVELKITIKKSDGQEHVSTITIHDGWREGTYYVYYLKLSPLDDEIILADFVVAPWMYAGDVTIDEPLTNW